MARDDDFISDELDQRRRRNSSEAQDEDDTGSGGAVSNTMSFQHDPGQRARHKRSRFEPPAKALRTEILREVAATKRIQAEERATKQAARAKAKAKAKAAIAGTARAETAKARKADQLAKAREAKRAKRSSQATKSTEAKQVPIEPGVYDGDLAKVPATRDIESRRLIVWDMHFLKGFDAEQIAEAIGFSSSTVLEDIRHIRQSMAHALRGTDVVEAVALQERVYSLLFHQAQEQYNQTPDKSRKAKMGWHQNSLRAWNSRGAFLMNSGLLPTRQQKLDLRIKANLEDELDGVDDITRETVSKPLSRRKIDRFVEKLTQLAAKEDAVEGSSVLDSVVDALESGSDALESGSSGSVESVEAVPSEAQDEIQETSGSDETVEAAVAAPVSQPVHVARVSEVPKPSLIPPWILRAQQAQQPSSPIQPMRAPEEAFSGGVESRPPFGLASVGPSRLQLRDPEFAPAPVVSQGENRGVQRKILTAEMLASLAPPEVRRPG